MRIIATLFTCAAMMVGSTAIASDYKTTQSIDAGDRKLVVLSLHAGHTHFDVSGKGMLACMALAPVITDYGSGLIEIDMKGSHLVAGQFVQNGRCSLDISLPKESVVVLLLENDDAEVHNYIIRGIY